jgi:hypothetical protein
LKNWVNVGGFCVILDEVWVILDDFGEFGE